MNNKRIDEPVNPSPRPDAGSLQPGAPRSSGTPVSPRPSDRAVIGASMHIKGQIFSKEELYIDGEVEGGLESQHAITIGPNGKVHANIKAREVTVFGSVHGNVEVTDRVSIRQNGTLIGDIKTAGIGIEDGAYFKGSIDIVLRQPAPTAQA